MKPHPLQGLARWLVLPGVGMAGGLIAGFAMTALVNTELLTKPFLWRVSGWGLLLGFAPGLATAFTSRGWLASLIAPALCFPLVGAVDWVLFDSVRFQSSAGFERYLRELIEPSFLQIGTALLTAPAAAFHSLRLGSNRRYRTIALHFAVAIAAAAWAAFYEGPRYFLPFLGFTGFLASGQVAAIELALRTPKSHQEGPS